jgi:ligand-binding SRPBCC domain-containing protein
MHDVIRYALPWGLLGRFAHAWRVQTDLEAIFTYRAEKVAEIFGNGYPIPQHQGAPR